MFLICIYIEGHSFYYKDIVQVHLAVVLNKYYKCYCKHHNIPLRNGSHNHIHLGIPAFHVFHNMGRFRKRQECYFPNYNLTVKQLSIPKIDY